MVSFLYRCSCTDVLVLVFSNGFVVLLWYRCSLGGISERTLCTSVRLGSFQLKLNLKGYKVGNQSRTIPELSNGYKRVAPLRRPNGESQIDSRPAIDREESIQVQQTTIQFIQDDPAARLIKMFEFHL